MGDKNSFQEFLEKEKYSVLPMPVEGITPLMVLGREKPEDELEQLGGIEDLFLSKADLPKIGGDMVVANISGKKTGKVSLSLGLKLINAFLEGFQAKVGINVSSEKADTTEIVFSDVFSNQVMPLKILNYIKDATLASKETLPYLDTRGKTFIITEVLKTSQLKMKVYDHNGKSVGVEAEVGAPASGHFSAEKDNENEKILSYQGDRKVVFAFKAVPVWYEGDKPTISCFVFRDHHGPPEVEYEVLSPESLARIR